MRTETEFTNRKDTAKSQPFPLLVIILGALTAFSPLSIDMYLPSFPDIAAEFKVDVAQVELSLATFFFGLSFGQLLYGTATDRFGRKKPLYVGLFIYCLASVICAFAPNVETLIFLRLFQALGACGGIVIARAMVRDLFDLNESARVFSLLLLIMGVAPIIAPLIGGYVALFLGWRAIFIIVSVVGAVTFAAVYKFLPETKMPKPDVKLSKTFGIYLKILSEKKFFGFALSGGLAQAGMFAFITGSPFVFINLFGVPAKYYGWLFGSNALGMVLLSQINGKLVRTFSPTKILRVCLVFTALIGLTLICVGIFGFSLWGLSVPIFFYVASLGMILPNTTAGALAEQQENSGAASALIGTFQYGLAAFASSSVSYFGNGTALPMTTIIGICGVTSFISFNFLSGSAVKSKLTISTETPALK